MKDRIFGNLKGFATFMCGCTFIGEGVMLAVYGIKCAFRGCMIGSKADAEYRKQVRDNGSETIQCHVESKDDTEV